MGIRDRDIRNALETLSSEFENLEGLVEDQAEQISKLEDENLSLKDQIENYQARIEELEEALAEAYLTSESDDGNQREDDKLSPGCGPDVPDSTGDEAAN